MKENILKQFDDVGLLYSSLGIKLKDILTELLKDNNIGVHNINCRLKDRSSLERKIDTKKDKYEKLEEITDVCGIRIITYLESDVDKVADILEAEFDVDRENSVDKRLMKIDQFGYRSLH